MSEQPLFYSVTRYETALFLFEYVKIQFQRQVNKQSLLKKLNECLNNIEKDIFPSYYNSLKKQVAIEMNKSDDKSPKPSQVVVHSNKQIEEQLLERLLQLKQHFPSDLLQTYNNLMNALKRDVKIMKYCVECVKLWYLHEPDETCPFAIPCSQPHLLVWARPKAEPFYQPAKLINFTENTGLVTYFGETRYIEELELNRVLLLTDEYPVSFKTLAKNSKNIQEQTRNQLNTHIKLLESKRKYRNSGKLKIIHSCEVANRIKEYLQAHGPRLIPEEEYCFAKTSQSDEESDLFEPSVDKVYNSLMKSGSVRLEHLPALSTYPPIQPKVLLDKVTVSDSLIFSESIETIHQNVPPASASSSSFYENVDQSPTDDDLGEISNMEVDPPQSLDVCHSNHQSRHKKRKFSPSRHSYQNTAIIPSCSKSSNSLSKLEQMDREATLLSQKLKSLRNDYQLRIEKLEKKFAAKFARDCKEFNPSKEAVIQNAREQFEEDLAKTKRTTFCSVCKTKEANIRLSLASANDLQWHPHTNNYAYCSVQCKWVDLAPE